MNKLSRQLLLSAYIIAQMTAIGYVYDYCVTTCKNSPVKVIIGFGILAVIAWVGLSITIFYFKNHTHNH